MDIQFLKESFQEQFGKDSNPRVFFSPGRINIIGEHTDYNLGFVCPAAIDKGIYVAIQPNGTDTVNLFAKDQKDEPNTYSFNISSAELPSLRWAKYIFGATKETAGNNVNVQGYNALVTGDLPDGAGLSSSAALVCTFLFALDTLFGNADTDRFKLARMGQAVEHKYLGLKCGIMDQFASLHGKKDNLILLDCRSLDYEYIPINTQGYRLVMLNTCVKHALGTEYNDRRQSCENGVAALEKAYPGIGSLRDATIAQIDSVKDSLSETDYRRSRYIIQEDDRVLQVRSALKDGNMQKLGDILYAGHDGESNWFEISCSESDYIVRIARECGVTGARQMGGGFGGCVINLVKEQLYDSYIETVQKRFLDKFGHNLLVYPISIGQGTNQLL